MEDLYYETSLFLSDYSCLIKLTSYSYKPGFYLQILVALITVILGILEEAFKKDDGVLIFYLNFVRLVYCIIETIYINKLFNQSTKGNKILHKIYFSTWKIIFLNFVRIVFWIGFIVLDVFFVVECILTSMISFYNNMNN